MKAPLPEYNEPLEEHDRVELVEMPNDPNPVPVGTRGTVVHVSKTPWEKCYHVEWFDANGKTISVLHLLEGTDKWKKIPNK